MSKKNPDGKKSKGSTNENREPFSNVDTRAGDKNRGIGSRGNALLRVGGVPGYNKQEGTPGWVKKAAARAEGLEKSHKFPGDIKSDGRQGLNGSCHREGQEHQAGAPPYGKKAEVDPRTHTQGGDGKQRIKEGREGS